MGCSREHLARMSDLLSICHMIDVGAKPNFSEQPFLLAALYGAWVDEKSLFAERERIKIEKKIRADQDKSRRGR